MTEDAGLCVLCSGTGLRSPYGLCPTCDGSGGKTQPADRDAPARVTRAKTTTSSSAQVVSEFEAVPSA